MDVYTVSLLLLIVPHVDEDVRFPEDKLIYQAMKDQAELLEIYDRDATGWRGFDQELRWVRANWRRWGCCLPAGDNCWLPSHEYCRDRVRFADAFVSHLDELLLWSLRKEDLRDVREEAQELRLIWQAAADATENGPGIIYRRRALNVLRDHIGPEAYRRGVLPPWVPYWHFDEGAGHERD